MYILLEMNDAQLLNILIDVIITTEGNVHKVNLLVKCVHNMY